MLLLAGGCALFACAAMSQIFGLPPGHGPNAVVSGALYTAAVLAVAEGVLLRSHQRLGWWLDVVVVCAITLALAWFFYIDRNLLVRIYIQNFGYGLILLVAALKLRSLMRGRLVDKALFWVLLAFALHFFPRTLLTVGLSAPVDRVAFANSVFWQALQLSLAVLAVGLAFAILAATIADVIDDLRRERDFDPLTGVLNRRGFEDRVMMLMKNPCGTTSLALCDIDKFKGINDTYGHDVGDHILREVGHLLRTSARKRDIVGRLGGEEFAVLLPDTDAREAFECAERLRTAIENGTPATVGTVGPVTASFGVGSLGPMETWKGLYKRVDLLLYQAKRTGRNRTVADDLPSRIDRQTEVQS
ncbi:GGDEF domain-containing protein [Pseudomonas sp. Q11]|uniref:GGDEF domain-containing protein n=1 Tax=Pseudomonas sp. Q11 TaxID=2968470 RepID=UPI00210A5322|nr:GGDEF domain-containing protein [Pseudomonas sp. Q11]MCQ6258620.1 GGDEF domain-containing protein [Pseudomonas sp. Q11]